MIYLCKVFVSSGLFDTDSSQAGPHTNPHRSPLLTDWCSFTRYQKTNLQVHQALPSSTAMVCSEAGDGGGEGGRLAVSSAAKDQIVEKWDTINPVRSLDV